MVDERAYIILRNIIALAHDLGLVLVAEGIESQEHIDRLSALGCEFGQGFFIGQPMTAKQVIDALSGVPYSGSKKNVMTLLWERMVGDKAGKRKDEPSIAPPPPPLWLNERRRRRKPVPLPEPETVDEKIEREPFSEAEPIEMQPEPAPEPELEIAEPESAVGTGSSGRRTGA